MRFQIIKDVIQLLEQFETDNNEIKAYSDDIEGFKSWISDQKRQDENVHPEEPYWEGKEHGRSPESVINTLLVHLNRYAKTYSKSAIADSDFATQEDFIYLINLKALGAMTKMELIKKNIQDKPVGMLIINRLINQGWVEQKDSDADKRTKVISITTEGLAALDQQMDRIRKATHIVTGDLTYSEKMSLIRILDKLERFHHPIFSENINSKSLIDEVYKEYPFQKN
ncbi:MarR family winged helix-turn-helix transcriptional regulator [Chryseobacterium daecheongense]|uniref:MarR family transcriptional regulator n=1 Tax=Chryseobacterium daecheongense TaxID=192389 RepID=A0A3N0VZ70_9FLAO|nr:MarR family transcriptional regulator [Chryseobacterium daecheongense]ROH97820.1 MarR family transcriptional regulator [Chryseobacterium daecheongense]TDX93006.1 DNA-binding MarR family transcriptional regulator [Chryseobacterium daecheongense]